MGGNQRQSAKAAMKITIAPAVALVGKDHPHESQRSDRSKSKTYQSSVATPTGHKAKHDERNEKQALPGQQTQQVK